MALSERERRILEEIEEALERDDPELARRVSGADPGVSRSRRFLVRGWTIAAAVLLVVALMILAVALA
jgi:hypothetical protein